MIIRTPDEAFEAGRAAPCDHGLQPTQCLECRLTPAEIGRLAVLHRPYLRAEAVPHDQDDVA